MITLPRTGHPPLTFDGELIAEASSRLSGGQEQNRWHELALYRTEQSRFVGAITYRTCWQGELDHSHVEIFPFAHKEDEVIAFFTGYDPTAHCAGYPPGAQFVEKQRRMLAQLRGNYEAAVSELFDAAGIKEVLR